MPELTDFLMWCSILNVATYVAGSLVLHFASNSFWKSMNIRDARPRLASQLANYLNLIVLFNLVPYLVLEIAF